MNTKKSKKVVWVISGILILGCLMLGIAYFATAPGRQEVAELEMATVDFSTLQDGIYTGYFKAEKNSLYDTQVEIVVSGKQVTEIRSIGGLNGGDKQYDTVKNGESLDDLFTRIIEEGTVQVDLIAGATLTSKSYLKAVEDALMQSSTR